jgi:hypothetical protein
MSKMWKQWIHSSTTVRNSQWPDRPRLSKIDSGFPSSNYHGPIVYKDFSVYERFANARPLTIVYPLFQL